MKINRCSRFFTVCIASLLMITNYGCGTEETKVIVDEKPSTSNEQIGEMQNEDDIKKQNESDIVDKRISCFDESKQLLAFDEEGKFTKYVPYDEYVKSIEIPENALYRTYNYVGLIDNCFLFEVCFSGTEADPTRMIVAVDKDTKKNCVVYTTTDYFVANSVVDNILHITVSENYEEYIEHCFVKKNGIMEFVETQSSINNVLLSLKGLSVHDVYSNNNSVKRKLSLYEQLEQYGDIIASLYKENEYGYYEQIPVLVSKDGTIKEYPIEYDISYYVIDRIGTCYIYQNYREYDFVGVYIYDYEKKESKKITDRYAEIVGHSGDYILYLEHDEDEYGIKKYHLKAFDTQKENNRNIVSFDHKPGSEFSSRFFTESFSSFKNRIHFVIPGERSLEWYSIDLSKMPYVLESIGLIAKEYRYSDIGHYEAIGVKKVCNECGAVCEVAYYESFIFDENENLPGSAVINEKLKEVFYPFDEEERVSHICEATHDEWHDEDNFENDENEIGLGTIDFVGENYINITVSGYMYPGGAAHGFPSLDSFIFDIKTGEQKNIFDFYNGTEDELRNIIAEAVLRDYEKYGSNSYYEYSSSEELYNTAYEICLSQPMIFTNEALKVSFHPYDLGPFSSGFIEIEIPYENLDITI